MIPTIEIPRSDVFHLEYDPRTGDGNVVCYSYFYTLDIRDALTEARLNLDHFLTRRIVGRLYTKPPKSKLMFLFAPLNHGDLVMVCSKTGNVPCSWLTQLPAYSEWGRDFIARNSTPFIYWDGGCAYRIYRPPSERRRNAHYVIDMVPLDGSLVFATTKREYDAIAADPLRYWDYAAIPADGEQTIDLGRRQVKVMHAFVRFV